MNIEDIKIQLSQNIPFIILMILLTIPTILHFSLQANNITPPFAITSLALTNPFKAIVGITVGVLIGLFLNRKYGD